MAAAARLEVASSEADRSGRRKHNIAAGALVGLLVVLAWQHRWTFDDGFINFRIVKQLEAGHGPVFNSGQRVEAYTSPLWLFVLAFFDIVTPIRIEWISVFLGIAFTATGLTASIAASRRLWSGLDERAAEIPIGALTIVATFPIWYFATSGLEGGLTFAWLGTSLWVLARWATRPQRLSRLEWLLVGAGWLVRPELVLFSLAAAIAVVAAERSERSVLRRIVATGWAWLLPVAYEIFRMGYFASLLPNTAFAKAATSTRWDKGWQYLSHFVGTYWLWLPAAVLVIAGYAPLITKLARMNDRRLAVIVAWLAGTVLTTVYIVRIGGDYIDARLLLPSFFAFAGPVATTRAATPLRTFGSVALFGWAVIAATSLRPPLPYRAFVSDDRNNVVTISDALEGPAGRAVAALKRTDFSFEGRPITAPRNPALPRRTAAISGIGILSYALGTDVYVFDLGGLADPITARFELTSRGLPGHEKFEPPPWSAAILTAPGSVAPTPAQLSPITYLFTRPLIPTTEGIPFGIQITEARHALRCGDLRDLQAAVEDHLTVGRFLSNLAHSFAFTTLTVPPDPAKAEAKFCSHR